MNIDHIYVISVREATKRREKIKNVMSYLDLDFYIVDRDSNPTRGCFNSHNQIIKIAKENGYRTILIFEDDAYPLHSFETIKSTINDFLKSPPNDWKYCLLGYLPIRSNRVSDSLYKLRCAYDLHAYLVNLDNVDEREWDGKYCDSLLCKGLSPEELFTRPDVVLCGDYNEGIYGVVPMLYRQDSQESYINDISLTQKYFFEFFGGYDNSVIVSSYTNSLYIAIFIIINIILLFFWGFKEIKYILFLLLSSLLFIIDFIFNT